MRPLPLMERLDKATTIIAQICNISGSPSASVGILHHDEMIWDHGFGYRDVAAQKRPTPDTMYGIGSLTKGLVAAGLGQLFDREAALSWLSPVQDIIPSFKPKSQQLDGLLADMSVASQGDMEFLLAPKDMIPTIANLDSVAPFRRQWMYNNWGYSMAGAVIEELSKRPFYDHVKDVVLDPLNLSSTTTRPVVGEDSDFAEAYTALHDASFHPLPRVFPFKGSVFEAAGAVLKAERDPHNQIPLDNPSRDCRFYGMGWIGTQLPGVVGLQGDNADLFDWDELPILGQDSQPMMTYYHQGAGLGYYSAIFTFPETRSAIAVLTNSIPLNDAADWIVQVLVSALFGFPERADYVHLAQESRRRKLANVAAMKDEFDRIREDHPGSSMPYKVFFIKVREQGQCSNCLEISFQGMDTQVYKLRHLTTDVFEWAMEYDESARRARFTIWDPKYFEIDFQFEGGDKAVSLRWAKWTDLSPEGIPMNRQVEDVTKFTSDTGTNNDLEL
ncbi:penicillin-binding protein [Emericellopsis atlantica]|uniref:Penicillin-binding protein n=1 Tax=Emericellopsis atlantica TaxID=2614577 RepID=A0A9P7ZNV9_9HYPO|nr:penicillin-binding protein [Emericellopsis atlantica]KAG9255475.1 penicillin-binding protein [Emericellopsis atlantica]